MLLYLPLPGPISSNSILLNDCTEREGCLASQHMTESGFRSFKVKPGCLLFGLPEYHCLLCVPLSSERWFCPPIPSGRLAVDVCSVSLVKAHAAAPPCYALLAGQDILMSGWWCLAENRTGTSAQKYNAVMQCFQRIIRNYNHNHAILPTIMIVMTKFMHIICLVIYSSNYKTILALAAWAFRSFCKTHTHTYLYSTHTTPLIKVRHFIICSPYERHSVPLCIRSIW